MDDRRRGGDPPETVGAVPSRGGAIGEGGGGGQSDACLAGRLADIASAARLPSVAHDPDRGHVSAGIGGW